MSNLPEPSTKDFLKARESLITNFKRELYGDDWEQDSTDSLNIDPKYQYICGVLYPQETFLENEDADLAEIQIESEEDSENDNSRIDHDFSEAGADEDEENTESANIIDLSSQRRPSAFGLNFLLNPEDEIRVSYGFSTYSKEEGVWKRTRTFDQKTFIMQNGSKKEKLNEDLFLSLKVFKSGNQIIAAVSIYNNSKDETKIYYQAGLKIENINSHFLPIKNPLQSGYGENAEALDLLFRNKNSYSIGKGCASDWVEDHETKECKMIYSSFIPTYETKSITPEDIEGLSMDRFSDIEDKYSSERYLPLDDLVNDYEKWIKVQEEKKETLEEKFENVASKNIEGAKKCLERMKRGLGFLNEDENIEKCFRAMNFAMLLQMNRLNKLERKEKDEGLKVKSSEDDPEDLKESLESLSHKNLKGSWRPFQIAFILSILPEIVEPDKYKSFREEVDLIWFPTGGGKTEAYLGLIAFSVLWRRFEKPKNAGVSAIMRYTLRLLTSDQFRRSAALICALEFIRKEGILDLELGEDEISLGLWVGAAGSPNTHKRALDIIRGRDPTGKDRNGNYKFILHQCPWCKSKISNPLDYGYIPKPGTTGKAIIRCSDANCFFHQKLPVYLWEEAIFEEKPSLLLGTVDNFAKLSWKEEAINLIKNNDFDPPELVIQDELHLISGPLGTMVGLFENVLIKLMSFDKKTPKIIGASATLTFSDAQSKSLYRGRSSNIFPPQVIDWEDSFFAKEREIDEEPGRMYMGFFGSAKGSMIESSVTAATPLLQSPQDFLPITTNEVNRGDTSIFVSPGSSLKPGSSFTFYDGKEVLEFTIEDIKEIDQEIETEELKQFEIVLSEPFTKELPVSATLYPSPTKKEMSFDPYGTLVWYFNSKRELAYMSNQVQAMESALRRNAKTINKGKFGSITDGKLVRFSRKIKKIRELTGRRSQDEIESILDLLNVPWTQTFRSPTDPTKGIDILMATNMISVGVDIPRLGLMLMHGQPKTTAEYIQASSRVGRRHPGLVLAIYNHGKSKDRSVYEMFKNYHQSIYKYVETVSVTPFSSGARKKGLAAVFASLVLSFGKNINAPTFNQNEDEDRFLKSEEWILDSVLKSDPEEYDSVKKELEEIQERWKRFGQIEEWGKMGGRQADTRLFDPSSIIGDGAVFSAPTSMRNSDLDVEVNKNDGI